MADRVMMIGPIAPPQGGVSTLFQTLLDSDLKNRYRVSIFNTNKYRVKKRYRFSTDRVRITSFFELAIQMILLNFSLHKEKPTIIHIQSCKSSFLRDSMFIIISRFWRKKVVLHFHSFYKEDGSFFKNKLFKSYFVYMANHVSAMIVLSESFAHGLDEIIPDIRKYVVPNFIFPNDMNASKSSEIPDKSALNVLFVGRLSTKKGIYDLLDAAYLIKSKYDITNINFLIAGLGETENDERIVLQKLDEKDLKNNISLLGYIEGQRKIDLFKKSDILVLPSHTEVFPVVILEAMSFAMPVITTPVGANSDIIENNVNGFIIPPKMPEMLAEKILYFVQHPDEILKMGQNNLGKFRAKYQVDINIDKIDTIYQSLLEKG